MKPYIGYFFQFLLESLWIFNLANCITNCTIGCAINGEWKQQLKNNLKNSKNAKFYLINLPFWILYSVI